MMYVNLYKLASITITGRSNPVRVHAKLCYAVGQKIN